MNMKLITTTTMTLLFFFLFSFLCPVVFVSLSYLTMPINDYTRSTGLTERAQGGL